MRLGEFKFGALVKTILNTILVSVCLYMSLYSNVDWMVIFSTVPLLTLVLRHFLFDQRVSWIQIVGSALSVLTFIMGVSNDGYLLQNDVLLPVFISCCIISIKSTKMKDGVSM